MTSKALGQTGPQSSAHFRCTHRRKLHMNTQTDTHCTMLFPLLLRGLIHFTCTMLKDIYGIYTFLYK